MSGLGILRAKAAGARWANWRASRSRSICDSHLRRLSQSTVSDTAEPPGDLTAPPPGRKVLEVFKEEFEVGSRTIALETGKIARFANGSVVIGMEQTKVLSTVASAKNADGARDFLPLTVYSFIHCLHC